MYKFGYVDPYTKKSMPNTGSVLKLIENHFKIYRILDNKSPFQWIVKIS